MADQDGILSFSAAVFIFDEHFGKFGHIVRKLILKGKEPFFKKLQGRRAGDGLGAGIEIIQLVSLDRRFLFIIRVSVFMAKDLSAAFVYDHVVSLGARFHALIQKFNHAFEHIFLTFHFFSFFA